MSGGPQPVAVPAAPSYAARTRRYALAAAGPIAVAGANFLLSFSMLRLESPAGFGTFTFLFAAAVFTISLAGALFGAPLQALHADAAARAGVVAALAAATLAAALAAWAGFALLGVALGLPAFAAACYGGFAALTILRSVGRAWCYAVEQAGRVATSDIGYAAGVLLGFAGLVGVAGMAPARAVYPALALGTAAAVASLGRPFAALLWRSSAKALGDYAAIWRRHARWSLSAVVATELVANAHIYLLALLSGAAAVAPVAASALLVRPINVIQNALIEFERPQMARLLAEGAMADIDRSVRLFRAVLLLVWGGTVAVGAAILVLRPALVFPAGYDLATIRLAAALWAAVSLAIVVQVPWNVLLQAAGAFRRLAYAAFRASAVSVAGVLLAIALDQPVWTIAAIVPGWLVSTLVVRRAADELRRRGLASFSGT